MEIHGIFVVIRVENFRIMTCLDYLIDYLLKEDSRYSEMEIPSDLQGKRDLFRALRNVRPPHPVSEEFLRLQDDELQAQLQEKGVVELPQLPTLNSKLPTTLNSKPSTLNSQHPTTLNSKPSTLNSQHPTALNSKPSTLNYILWQGDITRLRVDAIVNAANSQMLGCFHPLHRCIDNAIHSAAGVQLRQECHEMMLRQGHEEPTGQAKITKAYNLPCKHVIHTVGPIVPNGIPTEFQQEQLASCYRSVMACAAENKLESVAFCCISTGEFRFPNRLAAEIAVRTVTDYLSETPDCSVKTAVFNVFKDRDKEIYAQILAQEN